ncbi:MAG: hypothetical protein K2K67_00300, partial [Treponemataceae bacterium]|nr:hypothetical protein [Treponemataceae bacterium]
NKLEDLVTVPESTPDGKTKSQLELLNERIQKIQQELPAHTINEEEQAFNEAAEHHRAVLIGEANRGDLKKSGRR